MRLYFNLVNGSETLRDKEGIELFDLDEIRFEVFKGIKEARAENANAPTDWQGWRMDVVDRSGSVVLSIPLSTVPCD